MPKQIGNKGQTANSATVDTVAGALKHERDQHLTQTWRDTKQRTKERKSFGGIYKKEKSPFTRKNGGKDHFGPNQGATNTTATKANQKGTDLTANQ